MQTTEQLKEDLKRLSAKVIRILEIEANRGCDEADKGWGGFCNGNGTDIGHKIEALIRMSHKIQNRLNSPQKKLDDCKRRYRGIY